MMRDSAPLAQRVPVSPAARRLNFGGRLNVTEGSAAPVAALPMVVYNFAELITVSPTPNFLEPTLLGRVGETINSTISPTQGVASLSCLIGYLYLSTCMCLVFTWIVTSVQLVWIENKCSNAAEFSSSFARASRFQFASGYAKCNTPFSRLIANLKLGELPSDNIVPERMKKPSIVH
jgi:hypothetical protein